jgi:hypothetical protein
MNQIRFVGVLIAPSVASTVLCIGLSGLVFLASALTYNARTGFLYDLLFGPGSSATLIETSRDTLDALFQTLFGNPTLNKLIFFIFWCLVGLVVYFLLSGIGRTMAAISETAHESRYLHLKKLQFEEQVSLRLMTYSMSLMGIFLYSIFFIRTLFPFSILCGRIGVGSIDTLSGWLYLGAGFIVLSLSIHIFIVLIRLLLLRPRIYGGWEDVLESEFDPGHKLDD